MKDTTAVLSFYEGTGRDQSGRTLREVLACDLERREAEHDYIQWLFPIPEPSGANPYAPVLTPAAIQEFQARPEMRERLGRSFLFMLEFFGLELKQVGAAGEPGRPAQGEPEAAMAVVEGPDFGRRAPVWLYPGSHNFLRISRILRCLRLLGLKQEAAAFLAWLEDLRQRHPELVPARTLEYWRKRGAE